MTKAISFEDFKGITKQEAKSNVSYSIELEKAVSDVTGVGVNKKAVFRTDAGDDGNTKLLLGLVPESRNIIPYSEVTDWICNELDTAKVEYKILDSTVYGKRYGMQQRYLLEGAISNPDGYNLSPMLIVNSSYVGVPVALEMGTYRFICSNGAVVGGNVFERTKISARQLNDFGKLTVGDVIHRGLTRIVALTERYQELADEDYSSYLGAFLNCSDVDVEFKKNLIKYLYNTMFASPLTDRTLKNEDFIHSYIRDGKIYDGDSTPIIEIDTNKTKSAWELYNDATYLASHESSTIHIQNRMNHQISKVFAA